MLSVVCMKWRGERELPWQTAYTAAHVNSLRHMVTRYLHVPHRFICITDEPEGLDGGVTVVPLLWPERGGLSMKLRLFSDEMRDVAGPRFFYLDLDVVIAGDITPLATRTEDLVLNSYKPPRPDLDQHYNTSIMLMDAGARRQVWDRFSEQAADDIEHGYRSGVCTRTDQGWVRLVLGKGEARFTEADGVYEAWQTEAALPESARIVCFSGPRDPTTSELPWVAEHYR